MSCNCGRTAVFEVTAKTVSTPSYLVSSKYITYKRLMAYEQ